MSYLNKLMIYNKIQKYKQQTYFIVYPNYLNIDLPSDENQNIGEESITLGSAIDTVGSLFVSKAEAAEMPIMTNEDIVNNYLRIICNIIDSLMCNIVQMIHLSLYFYLQLVIFIY